MADKEKQHPQTQHDDQEWLDALAGKKTEGADTPVGKQAELLRRAIAAEQINRNDDLDQISARRMRKALSKRLRKERLIDTEQIVSRKRSPKYAAGVAIVLVALIGYWWMYSYPLPKAGMSDGFPDHMVTRADLEVQRLPVESPDRATARLLSEFKALDLPWRLSRIGDDWLLEVFVGPEPSREIADWVKNKGYRVDEAGWLYLLITQVAE